MILNGWAVIDLFCAGVRIALALVVLVAVRADLWRRAQPSAAAEPGERGDHGERGKSGEPAECGERGERRRALAVLSGWVLLTLVVVSWPLFYAVLQSYVPHWPGVMCIYGVTRVGETSPGLSGWLPWLVSGVEWAKPLTVFLSGAWGAMYLADRRCVRADHRHWGARALGLLALVAFVDAGLEGSYLLIPKREQVLDAGCCVGVLELGRSGRFLPSSVAMATGDRTLGLATVGVTATLVVGLAFLTAAGSDRTVLRSPPLLVLPAAATIPLGLLFLRQVLAPRFLSLPYHYCAYDLWPQVPEALVGVGLYFLGAFAVGWAAAAATMTGQSPASDRNVKTNVDLTRQLLFVSLGGYVTGGVLLSVEWWLSG